MRDIECETQPVWMGLPMRGGCRSPWDANTANAFAQPTDGSRRRLYYEWPGLVRGLITLARFKESQAQRKVTVIIPLRVARWS